MRRRRLPALLLAAGVAAPVAFGGCGGETSDAEAARRQQVAEIRAAAEAGDLERAKAEVVQLQALVTAQADNGQVDGDEAMRIVAAANDVTVALGGDPAADAAPPTTAAPPATEPPPPPAPAGDGQGDDDDDDDDGNDGPGEGKGEGRGKGGDKGKKDKGDDD